VRRSGGHDSRESWAWNLQNETDKNRQAPGSITCAGQGVFAQLCAATWGNDQLHLAGSGCKSMARQAIRR
jgi:hypothetical protein